MSVPEVPVVSRTAAPSEARVGLAGRRHRAPYCGASPGWQASHASTVVCRRGDALLVSSGLRSPDRKTRGRRGLWQAGMGYAKSWRPDPRISAAILEIPGNARSEARRVPMPGGTG